MHYTHTHTYMHYTHTHTHTHSWDGGVTLINNTQGSGATSLRDNITANNLSYIAVNNTEDINRVVNDTNAGVTSDVSHSNMDIEGMICDNDLRDPL